MIIATMCSRRGRQVLLGTLLLIAVAATPAAGKSYSAERFDAVIRVLPDGTLDVTETVVFRFEDGPFTEVFREIPRRRTDGVQVMRAEMQGRCCRSARSRAPLNGGLEATGFA